MRFISEKIQQMGNQAALKGNICCKNSQNYCAAISRLYKAMQFLYAEHHKCKLNILNVKM